MPVSWTDPYGGQGMTPAEALARVAITQPDTRILASIAAQRERERAGISQSVQSAIAGAAQLMQQRQRDQIANSLLAQMQAPKATLASPTQQVVPGQPSAQLSGAEAARNVALGYGTTPGQAPDLGGELAYKAQLAAQQTALEQQLLQAKIGETQALGKYYAGGGGRAAQAPLVQTPYGVMTPYQAGSLDIRGTQQQRLNLGPDPWEGAIPLRRGKIATQEDVKTYGIPKTGVGQFTNAYGEAATGPQIQVQMPNGKQIVMPYEQWQAIESSREERRKITAPEARQSTFGTAPTTTPSSVPRVTSEAQARLLPKGTLFYGPDGQIHQVP